MKNLGKFDIALSFATEDSAVVDSLIVCLDKRKIRYYDFRKHSAAHWGKNLYKITRKIFDKAEYALIIVSKDYPKKYWSGFEKAILLSKITNAPDRILPLRLDETEVADITSTVFEWWKDNPEEIAEKIAYKLKKRTVSRWVLVLAALALVVFIAFKAWNSLKPKQQGENLQTLITDSLPGRPVTSAAQPKVYVNGGDFTMGNNYAGSPDSPEHTVTVGAFYISNTEVTVLQYRTYCDNHGKALPVQPPHPQQDACPVVNISWYEALAYCKSVGGRLPTEAEWEYAAKIQQPPSFRYSGSNNAGKVAVYREFKPSKVATKEPNSLGLYDMTGNVAEWCMDWYDSTYYKTSAGSNPVGPTSGKEKVIRGGAYNSVLHPTNELQLTRRDKSNPADRKPYVGFRVVWDK